MLSVSQRIQTDEALPRTPRFNALVSVNAVIKKDSTIVLLAGTRDGVSVALCVAGFSILGKAVTVYHITGIFPP